MKKAIRPIDPLKMNLSGFWSRIQYGGEDDCWEWTGGRTVTGYGLYKTFYAHRIMASVMKGGDVGDFVVCHKCDNPPCCNPHHLFVGTLGDNARDARDKGRLRLEEAWASCRGEKNPLTKLTADDVREIKRRARNGEGATKIAKDYPCGNTAISNIVKGRNWAHIG